MELSIKGWNEDVVNVLAEVPGRLARKSGKFEISTELPGKGMTWNYVISNYLQCLLAANSGESVKRVRGSLSQNSGSLLLDSIRWEDRWFLQI